MPFRPIIICIMPVIGMFPAFPGIDPIGIADLPAAPVAAGGVVPG
jgi:hypothetical protein